MVRLGCPNGRLRHAVAVALVATSCASADRDGAARLADGGVAATSALRDEIDRRSDRLRRQALQNDYNVAYSTFRRCGTGGASGITLADGPDRNCDVLVFSQDRRKAAVNAQFARLADILDKRRRAVAALGVAHRTFGAEAAYDAAGDMEAAIGAAAASADTLAGAVGLGAVSSVASDAVAAVAGGLADRSQRRRLIAGSRRLEEVTRRVRTALEAEIAIHEAQDVLLADLDEQTRGNLLRGGLLVPAPTLREVAQGSGFPVPSEAAAAAAASREPAVQAAAQVAAMSRLRSDGTGALRDAVEVLLSLEQQHSRFRAGRALGAADLAKSIDRLAAVAAAIRED